MTPPANTELTAAIEQCTSSADAWALLRNPSAHDATERTHLAVDDVDLLSASDHLTSLAKSSSLAFAQTDFRSLGRTNDPNDIEFRKRIAFAVTCQIASQYLGSGTLTKPYDESLVESTIKERIKETIADTIAESYHMHVPRRQLHTVCPDDGHFSQHREKSFDGSQTWPDCAINGTKLDNFHTLRRTVCEKLGWKWDETDECAVEPIVVEPGF